LLREVVERLKRGEDVDVETVLGTGVPEREEEWRGLVEEIEKMDLRWRKEKKSDRLDNVAKEAKGAETAKIVVDEAPIEAPVEVERRKIGPIPKGFY